MGTDRPDDAAVIDLIRAAEAHRIKVIYGATSVWFGRFTREWWALDGRARLVHGRTPDLLGEAIAESRTAP